LLTHLLTELKSPSTSELQAFQTSINTAIIAITSTTAILAIWGHYSPLAITASTAIRVIRGNAATRTRVSREIVAIPAVMAIAATIMSKFITGFMTINNIKTHT